MLLSIAAAPAGPQGPDDDQNRPPQRPAGRPAATATPTAEPRLTLEELLRRHPGLREILCKEPTYALREGDFLLPIFMYHNFEGKGYLSVSATNFEEQLALLRALDYQNLTFGEVGTVLSETRRLPARPVVLTFDDGWVSQYTVAYPLMQRYGMRGTFFVLAHPQRGNGEMGWDMLKTLIASGMEIGSHTRSHLKFEDNVAPGRVWSEVYGSRQILEENLSVPIVSFAYPYGMSGGGARAAVRAAGYSIAAGTGGSLKQNPRGRYYMYRIEVSSSTTLEEFATWLPWRAPALCATPVPPASSTQRPARTPRPYIPDKRQER